VKSLRNLAPAFCLAAFCLLPGITQPAQAQTAAGTMLAQPRPAQVKKSRKNPFAGVRYWAYQLKNLTAKTQARIARSPFDLVVVDYARGKGIPQIPLTRQQVAAMKHKPGGGRRLIIAYLSIGEAEIYRYYWKRRWNNRRHRPSWIGKESKEWKGNYLVTYWNRTWQNIIFGSRNSYVDRILKAGFDGFYIDRADAYYRFGDNQQARNRMSDFVIRLSHYIRSKKPDAAIMMQNAEELLTNVKLVDAIDAIAKEDLLYGISYNEELNKQDDIVWSTDLLEGAKKRGKRIFVVEYLTKPSFIANAKKYMKDHGYVFYYGPRGLFEIRESVVTGKTTGQLRRSSASDDGEPHAVTQTATAVKLTGGGAVADQSSAGAANACPSLTEAVSRGAAAIKFRKGSSRLQHNSFAALDRIATAARHCRKTRLEIAGYTDSDGSARNNKRLSRRRAQQVAAYLARNGVGRRHLRAIGYGATHPLAPNDTSANKARNRRIEIKLLPQ